MEAWSRRGRKNVFFITYEEMQQVRKLGVINTRVSKLGINNFIIDNFTSFCFQQINILFWLPKPFLELLDILEELGVKKKVWNH